MRFSLVLGTEFELSVAVQDSYGPAPSWTATSTLKVQFSLNFIVFDSFAEITQSFKQLRVQVDELSH
jgi:hypothetical protein